MKKELDMANEEKFSSSDVIARGYDIYYEWNARNLASRKIVEAVEGVVATLQANASRASRIDALSYLWALDVRINEKYKSLICRLFFYFALRRESHAFYLLMDALNILWTEENIREAIEVELRKIREEKSNEKFSKENDNIRGGKQNGISDEEMLIIEEQQEKSITEESIEEISEVEETIESTEVRDDGAYEQTAVDERIEDVETIGNIEAPDAVSEAPKSETEITVQADEQAQIMQESSTLKEENNGSYEKSEPSIDKTTEAKTYNDAVDAPFIYESVQRETSTAKSAPSYLDEVVFNNALKATPEATEQKPTDATQQISDEPKEHDEALIFTQSDKASEPEDEDDYYLYDEMLARENARALARAEKAPEAKASEQTIADAENGESKAHDSRVQIHVDISPEVENDMKTEVSKSLTDQMILAIKAGQEIQAREQLSMTYAELGINEIPEIVGQTEMSEVMQANVISNGK